eukprot:3073354-Alexandrium_andersonii.AAC.1
MLVDARAPTIAAGGGSKEPSVACALEQNFELRESLGASAKSWAKFKDLRFDVTGKATASQQPHDAP